MTNKPMLSVERELIQRIADHCKFWIDHPYLEAIADVEVELRALLNKQYCGACDGCANGCKLDRESPQVAPAAQHQGEPVAYMVQTGRHVEVLFEGNDWLYKYRKAGMRVTPLYAEQPEPLTKTNGEPVMSGYDLERIENALEGLDPDEYCEGVEVHDIGMLLKAVRTLQVRQILSATDEQPEPVRWERMSEMQGGTWWPCANKAEADQAVNCGWTVRPLYADRQPTSQRYSMHTVMLALERSKERITLTSNQCHALANALNEAKP